MTLTPPTDLQDFVGDKVRVGAYAVKAGWQGAKAGNLTSAEDFEIEFEEFKSQWHAERGAASVPQR